MQTSLFVFQVRFNESMHCSRKNFNASRVKLNNLFLRECGTSDSNVQLISALTSHSAEYGSVNYSSQLLFIANINNYTGKIGKLSERTDDKTAAVYYNPPETRDTEKKIH